MNPLLSEPLGPALAEWNDFVGSAAADELEVGDEHQSLYELGRLSPSHWVIVGVDHIEWRDAERTVLYAVDRQTHGITSHADLLEVADAEGGLSVVAFEVPADPSRPGLASLFRQCVVRLTARGLRDQPLLVADRRRVPAPDHREPPP